MDNKILELVAENAEIYDFTKHKYENPKPVVATQNLGIPPVNAREYLFGLVNLYESQKSRKIYSVESKEQVMHVLNMFKDQDDGMSSISFHKEGAPFMVCGRRDNVSQLIKLLE